MQITFLVGNGFDISCGLHSSYGWFYDWYCKQNDSKLAHVNEFRRTIDADIQAGKRDWADFEKALGQYTKNFTKNTAQQFIDCYNDAQQHLMTYLEQEMARFDYEISDDDIQQLRKGLEKFYHELQPRENTAMEALMAKYKMESCMIQFVSYNYTDVLDTIISKISNEPLQVWNNAGGHRCVYSICPTIIHAHGTLDKFPVFGVNDESQIANKELLSVKNFSRLMIKPRCVKDLNELWHDEVKKAIENSTIICIFGMSLGETDSIWFETIMDWIRADENRHIIVFWEKKTPTKKKYQWQYFSDASEVLEKITDYSDCTDAQIEFLSPRIHYIGNTEHVLRVKLQEKKQTNT